MEDVILNKDLKYIIKNLNQEQKGTLLDLLLEEKTHTQDKMVENLFTYISKLQEKIATKKSKMKTLSLLAHSTKKNNLLPSPTDENNNFADGMPTANLNQTQRKEAKEIINNLNNININNNPVRSNFSKDFDFPLLAPIKTPTLDEVKDYITSNNYNVDAETFIDFYESRNWCVGKSEIKNWQATVRMWNRRAKENTSSPQNLASDENYWHELKQKYWQPPSKTPPVPPPIHPLVNPKPEPLKLDSHFSRYMRRIEQNDF